MTDLFKRKEALIPLSLTQRPFSVSNSNENIKQEFMILENNSYKINKKKDFFSLVNKENKTFCKQRKKSDIHPLDFYTLGKIPSTTTINPFLVWNKAIRSNSNDIIYRNALSINTKKYNELDINKKLSNIYEQNITENNYMEPIKTYKTYEKYNLPKNATNTGMYKLMKEKYFSKDIHSKITQGKCLSKKDFLKQKERIMKKEILNMNNISSNKDKKFEEIKIDGIKNKYKNEDIKKINKSLSYTKGLIYRDPNDYSKQDLKNNSFYFDKNNNQMLKQKKWIINYKK